MTVGIRFLNVDLDLKSRDDLAPLVARLGTRVVEIHSRKERGFHYVSLELSEQRYANPDACIARFAALVLALPAPAKLLWDHASQRQFNIGIEAAAGDRYEAVIKAPTLALVAQLRGEVAVTVYGPTPRRRRARPSTATVPK